VAVVIFGERPYAEFQGDLENLEFSGADKHPLRLLRRLRALKIPTVSVFLSGRPMWVNPEINNSDAFVAAWLPGSEGEGVADVLFGRAGGETFDFTGRLSFSWPGTAMPVTFQADGSVSGALYPRGFGLTYRSDTVADVLSEDPKIPALWRRRPGSLFAAAHVTAPWTLFVADNDAQVHVTTKHQASPHGAVSVDLVPEGFQATWDGTHEGLLEISGRALDLRTAATSGGTLTFRYRIEVLGDQKIRLGMMCTEARCATKQGVGVDLTQALRMEPYGEWRTQSVPLSCFSADGADLSAVEMPFVIGTAGHLKLTISDVTLLAAGSANAHTCPRSI
jgi:beta-glucosidase